MSYRLNPTLWAPNGMTDVRLARGRPGDGVQASRSRPSPVACLERAPLRRPHPRRSPLRQRPPGRTTRRIRRRGSSSVIRNLQALTISPSVRWRTDYQRHSRAQEAREGRPVVAAPFGSPRSESTLSRAQGKPASAAIMAKFVITIGVLLDQNGTGRVRAVPPTMSRGCRSHAAGRKSVCRRFSPSLGRSCAP